MVSTAVRPRTPPFEQVAVLRTYWSGRYEHSLAWDPVHLIPDRDAFSVPGPERRVTSISAGQRPFWWAWEDLNLGPHPDMCILGVLGGQGLEGDLVAGGLELATAR